MDLDIDVAKHKEIINNVIQGCHELFLNEGIDENVLKQLKKLWLSKMKSNTKLQIDHATTSTGNNETPSRKFREPFSKKGKKQNKTQNKRKSLNLKKKLRSKSKAIVGGSLATASKETDYPSASPQLSIPLIRNQTEVTSSKKSPNKSPMKKDYVCAVYLQNSNKIGLDMPSLDPEPETAFISKSTSINSNAGCLETALEKNTPGLSTVKPVQNLPSRGITDLTPNTAPKEALQEMYLRSSSSISTRNMLTPNNNQQKPSHTLAAENSTYKELLCSPKTKNIIATNIECKKVRRKTLQNLNSQTSNVNDPDDTITPVTIKRKRGRPKNLSFDNTGSKRVSLPKSISEDKIKKETSSQGLSIINNTPNSTQQNNSDKIIVGKRKRGRPKKLPLDNTTNENVRRSKRIAEENIKKEISSQGLNIINNTPKRTTTSEIKRKLGRPKRLSFDDSVKKRTGDRPRKSQRHLTNRFSSVTVSDNQDNQDERQKKFRILTRKEERMSNKEANPFSIISTSKSVIPSSKISADIADVQYSKAKKIDRLPPSISAIDVSVKDAPYLESCDLNLGIQKNVRTLDANYECLEENKTTSEIKFNTKNIEKENDLLNALNSFEQMTITDWPLVSVYDPLVEDSPRNFLNLRKYTLSPTNVDETCDKNIPHVMLQVILNMQSFHFVEKHAYYFKIPSTFKSNLQMVAGIIKEELYDINQSKYPAAYMRNLVCSRLQKVPVGKKKTLEPKFVVKGKNKKFGGKYPDKLDDEILNSGDDVTEEEAESFDCENVITCEYTKITKRKNIWRVTLKNGTGLINGRKFTFLKANGRFLW